MPGIFGISGNTFQTERFEASLMRLEHYHVQKITPERHSLLGTTSFDFTAIHIFDRDDLVVIISGYYYSEGQSVTRSPDGIAQRYRKHGMGFLTQIDGVFNLLVFDKKKQKLFIANDWAGNQYLFYYFDGDTLIFAPEIKAIASTVPSLTVNRRALAEQVWFSYMLFDHTPFNEIALLNPATILEFDLNKKRLTHHTYHDLRHDYNPTENHRETDYLEELYALFDRATSKHLTESGIALPLTGGTDSRLLLHFLLKHQYDPKLIFTNGHKWDEDVRIARKICDKFGLDHALFQWPFQYFEAHFYKNYEIHDGLLPKPLFYPTFHRLYGKTPFLIQYPFNNTTFGDRFTPNSRNHIGPFQLNDTRRDFIIDHYKSIPKRILSQMFTKDFHYFDAITESLHAYFADFSGASAVLAFDHFTWYQHCRRVANIGGMNAGKLLGRLVPSQDRSLTMFAFNLPFNYRYWEYLLKKLLVVKAPQMKTIPREGTGIPLHWPQSIQMFFKAWRKHVRDRFKRRMPPPALFYRHHVNDAISRLFASELFRQRGVFDPEFVDKIWREHLIGQNHTYLIHNILNIEFFYRNLID